MNLTLQRDPAAPTQTYGVLSVGDLALQTIERPWIPAMTHVGGENGISCVPPGTYELEVHDSEAHPETWALVNHTLAVYHWPNEVPAIGGRSVCLIHPANWANELRGCIAPGMSRGFGQGLAMVVQSKVAFARLKAAVPWTPGHYLIIAGAT